MRIQKSSEPHRRRTKLHIGIDARFWGLRHAGLGRYVMELVNGLTRLDTSNNYTLFVRSPYNEEIEVGKNFRLVRADINHYSLEEQWLLPEIFNKYSLDLLHVPHFNVPLFYKKPFVVTIHDLLWHEVKGLSVTTQNPLTYLVKYLGYRSVVRNALNRSLMIFVPSRVILEKLVKDHGVPEKKIRVTYEAPADIFRPSAEDPSVLSKYQVRKPFVIYTGSAYPHKNIPQAAAAIKRLNQKGEMLSFVVASSRSVFLERLSRKLQNEGSDKYVRLIGFVPDEDLMKLYSQAVALLQPSHSEGFGLTGLEAMAVGLPVLTSRSPVFQEIYADAALYFDAQSKDDLETVLQTILNDGKLRRRLILKGLQRAKLFSWKTLVKQTLTGYRVALAQSGI